MIMSIPSLDTSPLYFVKTNVRNESTFNRQPLLLFCKPSKLTTLDSCVSALSRKLGPLLMKQLSSEEYPSILRFVT